MYRHFSENEFRRAVPACSLSQMDNDFMERLDTARSYSSVPFIINSAYRTVEYELEHKRSSDGAHTKGCAVDLRCCDSVTRLIIVKCLLRAGFRRIGIAKTFIHVDSDSSKPKCIWLYEQ